MVIAVAWLQQNQRDRAVALFANIGVTDGPLDYAEAPPLSRRDQQRISVATTLAYHRFRCECSAYHHTLGNYLMLMHWIDERRIEMQAEGRRHWVPSVRDFEQAMRDCWDDLVREPQPHLRSC